MENQNDLNVVIVNPVENNKWRKSRMAKFCLSPFMLDWTAHWKLRNLAEDFSEIS
jgi:hypothetical protein